MQQRGFTLIELLITVAIIGLLTAVATTSFVNAQRGARDDARKTSVHAIANAVEAYKLVSQVYPGEITAADGGNCAIQETYYYNPNLSCPDDAAFKPTPTWVPGLGKYLNPTPKESRYVDNSGGTTGTGSFDGGSGSGNTGAPTNATRTFSYKRTSTGYYVHAVLERTPTVYTVSK